MGGKIMAGGDYEIEIFGKRLRYSEAKLRELRLGNFFYELQSMESERVEMLFRVAGDFDGLLKLEVEKIMELYILMYENLYKYIKSLNLPENIYIYQEKKKLSGGSIKIGIKKSKSEKIKFVRN